MRIGRLFAVSMLSVTVLAVILGAGVLVPQYRDLCQQDRGDQGGGGLRRGAGGWPAGRQLSRRPMSVRCSRKAPRRLLSSRRPRRPVQAAMPLSPKRGRPSARSAIAPRSSKASIRQRPSLPRFARERSRAGSADERARCGGGQRLPAQHCRGCRDARTALESSRKSGRDGGRVADGAVECRPHVAGSADLRRRPGAAMSLAISTRRPLTAAEISSIDRGQGRVDLDRERIEAGVDQIGSPPRLAKAHEGCDRAYFGKVAPWLEKEMAVGRGDGNYAINSDQLASHDRAGGADLLRRARCSAGRSGRTRRRRARRGPDDAGAGRSCRRGAARRARRRHRDAAPARDHAARDA